MKLKNIFSILLLSDKGAISSTIDVMFFLVMVSLSTVVLMPVMLSSSHNAAVQDVAAYRFDGQLLQSLLDSRVENFEYMVVPSALSSGVVPSENSTSICQSNDIFAKQHAGRTFADLIAECMMFSLRIEDNGTYCHLHPFSEEYSEATERALEEHLNRRMGGRYNYRLEVNWQPVAGCGPSSQLAVGMVPPARSFRQSVPISVPYNNALNLADISSPADDFHLGFALSSSQKELELRSMFEECILSAASNSAIFIVELYYPEESLKEISIGQKDLTLIVDSLLGSPSSEVDIERSIAVDMFDNAVNVTENMCLNSTGNFTMLTEDNVALIGDQLRKEHANDIYSHLSVEMSDEINNTVQVMMQTNDSTTLLELRDKQLCSILTHVRSPAAEVTLTIW